MSLSAIKVIPVYRRHAVLLNNRGVKKSIVDMRSEAKMRLAEWAQEKMDDVRFANFVSTSPMNGETYTPEFTVVGGGSTGASDVNTTDLLDVQSLQIAKLDLYNNRAKPLMASDGNEYFGLVGHPNTLYNLKRSDEYRDWVREAAVRGQDNPFFKGAIAMIDGVLIFQHNNVVTALDGASSISVSRNVLFGAEAFVEGLDENLSWFEKEFDYNLQHGISFGFAFQPRRARAINSSILFAVATAP
jgi:N4-gp56 family major capsid protein